MIQVPSGVQRILVCLLCFSLLPIHVAPPVFSAPLAQATDKTDQRLATSGTDTTTPIEEEDQSPPSALATFTAFPSGLQQTNSPFLPWQQTAATLIHITDAGFNPPTAAVFGPTDVTWINDTASPHTLRSGEPGQADATKIFLPLVQRGSRTAVEAASVYLPYLYQQANSADFTATLAPGQSFTYRFTSPETYKFHLASAPTVRGELTLSGVALLRASPANGEGEVAVTRETVLEFSGALEPTSVTAAAFTVRAGSATLDYRLNLSADKRRVTLFYKEALHGSSRVRVSVDGSLLKDAQGNNVDVDGDGVAGGNAVLEFDTLSLTVIPGTEVCGRVFASELAVNASNVSVNTPLKDVTVAVDGLELQTKTDANGNFCLNPVPAGRFFVHVDGHSATNNIPAGQYYPVVGKAWQSIPGQTTNVGDIFLPLIPPGTLQPVSAAQNTPITFPTTVLQAHPEFNGVSILVPADSLFSDDGARGGKVGIAPVPPDRLPGGLPEGLNFPVVITVQTDGAGNFDTPAPVCFPNLPDATTGQPLAASSKSALWSFDHDTGRWAVVGPMTVSTDGKLVCTDAGVGIRAPGWHGSQPGTTVSGPEIVAIAPPSTPIPAACPQVTYPNLVDIGLTAGSCIKDFFKLGTVIDVFIDLSKVANDLYKQAIKLRDDAKAGRKDKAAIRVVVFIIQGNLGTMKTILDAASEQTIGKLRKIAGCVNSALTLLDDTCKGIINISDECLNFTEENFVKPYCQVLHSKLRIAAEGIERAIDLVTKGLTSFTIKSIEDILNSILIYLDSEQFAIYASQHSPTEPDPILIGMLDDLANAMTPLAISDENVTGLADSVNILGEYAARLGDAYFALTGPNPNAFVIVEYNEIAQRTRSNGDGSYSFFLPAETIFALSLYDPTSDQCGTYGNRSGLAGQETVAHGPLLSQCFGSDNDGDALSEEAEYIIGTDQTVADTDVDGIPDGAEIQNGTDPLGGFIAQTGIIGSADTPGTAVDICVQNDLAAIADSAAGVAIFNVFDSQNPKLIAQVDTPGNAQRVACGNSRVVVADGDSGLAIMDINNTANARIIHQVNLNGKVNAVATAGNVAYAATAAGRIVTVDITTGAVLSEVTVPEGVQDLALQAEVLYALTTKKLYAIALHNNTVTLAGSTDSPGQVGAGGRPWRLFVGGGLAYATHTQGYNTFDLTLPEQPILIKAGQTQQFGWKQIVPNGAGIGVAAVGPNSTNDAQHNISLYAVNDPQQTGAFITQFDTPGLAAAVTLYKGRAYVADSQAGMQVINYLSYDSQKAPPTIALITNFSPGKAEEGARLRITANTTDDVQVRNVEFYVDGKVATNDGNFPFEYQFITPRIADQPSFKLRSHAVDTGGNETWTDEQTITLVPDATQPKVTATLPANGGFAPPDTVTTVSAVFNEAMNPATVNANTFRLFSTGTDGLLNTADDQPVAGNVAYDAVLNTVTLTTATALTKNRYGAVLSADITDVAGNPLKDGEYRWAFNIGTIYFEDFSDLSTFTLNGVTKAINSTPVISNGKTVLRLTPDQGCISGSAFLSTPISLSLNGNASSFSTYFQFQIGSTITDGLAFILAPTADSLGAYGGYLGYSGIKPSLAVEFDTYHNGWDKDDNHVGIDLNGSLTSVVAQSVSPNFTNGSIWHVWIDYSAPNQMLTVYLADTNVRPTTATLSYPINLAQTLQLTNVHIGFSAGTCLAAANQDILHWSFTQ